MKTIEQMAEEAGFKLHGTVTLNLNTGEQGKTFHVEAMSIAPREVLQRFAALVAERKDRRIAELERAIRHAEEWIQVGEGVSLAYYMQEARSADVNASIAVIDGVLASTILAEFPKP